MFGRKMETAFCFPTAQSVDVASSGSQTLLPYRVNFSSCRIWLMDDLAGSR